MLDAVLVKGPQGDWFRFQLWEDRVFILNRREEYQGWVDFDDGFIEADMGELRETYHLLFGGPPPTNVKKVTLTKAIWAKRYFQAADRSTDYRTGGGKNHVTGEKERKRNLDGRRYRMTNGASTEHLQSQALTVHRELLKFQLACGRETISEGEVKTVMDNIAQAKTLKTKQDPFRIFQYYRAALIKANKMEMFE